MTLYTILYGAWSGVLLFGCALFGISRIAMGPGLNYAEKALYEGYRRRFALQSE